MNDEDFNLLKAAAKIIQKNKDILLGKVYVIDLDENFVTLGIPQPTRCSFEISQANQIAIYATRPRLREIYEALRDYYGETPKH